MAIQITKDDTGIKFRLGEDDPAAIIYKDQDVAIVKGDILSSMGETVDMAELILIVGVFIKSMQIKVNVMAFRDKAFDVLYVNEVTGETKEARYSPRNILKWMYSGSIVTVDKKRRIKFQFVSFGFKDGKMLVIYKPVIW